MNVPTGVNVDLLITDEENCQLTYNVFSPQCDCPPVPQPINPIVNTVCTNDPGPYLVSVEGTDPGTMGLTIILQPYWVTRQVYWH